MIIHGNKQISGIIYSRKASDGGGAVALTNIIRGPQVVFGGLEPSFSSWLDNAAKAAILAAFGQRDGKAVIKATNRYLSVLNATDPTKAQALAGFINDYPVNWGRLLVDFQPVDYIEKPTGTTIWVKTGIKPQQGDIEEIECEVAWNSSNGNNHAVIIGVAETSSYVDYSISYWSNNLLVFGVSTGVSLADHAFHTIKANTAEGTYVDGVLHEHTPVASPRNYANEQQLFNRYSNGYEVEHFFGKQKQMIAKINGSLVAWFVPCYNKTSNLIGMYDVVKGAMAGTGGSGAFLKGANVIINTPPTP